MSKPRRKHVADLIADEVSWFNGWHVSDKSFRESCDKAATRVMRYLRRRLRRETECQKKR